MNNNENDFWRIVALDEEIDNSVKLLYMGLSELQNYNYTTKSLHLSLQLIASGLERLMKCYICCSYKIEQNNFPDYATLKKYGGTGGHKIDTLLENITDKWFQCNSDSQREDYIFLTEDNLLKRVLELLSHFGTSSRYYNLDIVTSNVKGSRNVESEWKQFRDDLIEYDVHSSIAHYDMDILIKEADLKIIILIEKLICALSRQFTAGYISSYSRQISGKLVFFIGLKNNSFGTTDYSTKIREV